VSEAPPGRQGTDQPHNIAAAIAEVSERATVLVREEIELAKAEVTEKARKLVKGAIVGAVAGIFFLTALVFVLVGCAWLLYYFLPGGDFTYFWGFFAMAAILVVLGVIAGLVAARAVKRGSPPMPNMAIEEARKIRETVSPGAGGASAAGVASTVGVASAAGVASTVGVASSPTVAPTAPPAPIVEPIPDPVAAVAPEAVPDLAPAPAVEDTLDPAVEEPLDHAAEETPDPAAGPEGAS
jgi:uncharacterized membrane protein YqjE